MGGNVHIGLNGILVIRFGASCARRDVAGARRLLSSFMLMALVAELHFP